MWTDESTHVLHNAQDPQPYFLTKGDLSPYIPCRYGLEAKIYIFLNKSRESFAWLQVFEYFIAFNVYKHNAKSFIVITHYIQCVILHSYFQCYLIVGGFSRLLGTWGVVTKMAPSTVVCFLRFSSTAKCSSDVPGGVSTSSTSSSPHATSDTNWLIKAGG